MHTYELIKVFKEKFRQRPKPAKSYSLLKDFKSRFDSKNRPSILEIYVSFVLVCMYLFQFFWRLLAWCFVYYFSLICFFFCDTIEIEFVLIRDPCLTLFLNILLTQFSFFIIYQSGPKKTLASPMKTAHAQLE